MSNKTLFYLSICCVASILVLLGIQLAPLFKSKENEKFLKNEEIEGIASVHQGKPYNLNYAQQSQVFNDLNHLKTATAEQIQAPQSFPVEAILVYRFKAAPLTIKIVGKSGDALLFTSAEWNSGKTLIDTSQGKLLGHLMETFDP